jgi:hypothetical protein
LATDYNGCGGGKIGKDKGPYPRGFTFGYMQQRLQWQQHR